MSSSAKKDFKNIYESGVQELSDIEAVAIEEAKKARTEHSKKQKQTAQQALDQLQTKSGLLQVELKQSINESLKKLQDSLDTENAQSEAFLASSMVELKAITGQLKAKLDALKQSHQENVNFARTVAAENYLSNTERMNFALEQALSNSLQNLKAKAKGNLGELASHLDRAIANIHNEIENAAKSNLVSLKNQTDTISDYSSSLLKTLFVDSQNKLSLLEGSARKAKVEVDSSVISLLDVIANHANSIEADINVTYESITSEHFKNADNRLSILADELSTLHNTTTQGLIMVTDDLSTDLLDRSKQAQTELGNRCDDVVNRVNNLFGSFQETLNNRLQFSRGQKDGLESDKNKILNALQNELLSIQKTFAKKITSMLNQSKTDLVEMTKSVETQILNASESLSNQMSQSAQAIQQQIENEVTRFMQELATVRSAALDEISASAKGNIVPKNIDKYLDKQQDNRPPATEFGNESTASLEVSPIEDDFLSTDEIQSDQISEETNISENKTRRNRRRKDNKE